MTKKSVINWPRLTVEQLRILRDYGNTYKVRKPARAELARRDEVTTKRPRG